MGYYATGGGCLELKSTPPNDIIEDAYAIFCDVGLHNGEKELNLCFDGKYHNDDIEDWNNRVVPYVNRGQIEFCGDDDCHWKYVFKDGEWDIGYGNVVYDNEPALFLSEKDKDKLLDEILSTIDSGSSTDGKPSVNSAAPTNTTPKSRLIDVLKKWRII